MSWNINTTRSRVQDAISQIADLKVVTAATVGDLDALSLTEARLIDGVHVYIELTNARTLLQTDEAEGERCHKRFLRFVHLYQRIARLVLGAAGADKIDFQNQRLHFVVASPSSDERKRCVRAVAVAALLVDVASTANGDDDDLPAAMLSVGIESGTALAVRNGTKGDREPLFLGYPANQAAKMLGRVGVSLGNAAAARLNVAAGAAGRPLLAACLDEAALPVTADQLKAAWRAEKEKHNLATFTFSEPRLPLSDLDLDALAPGDSRRAPMVSVFADVDGFSAFVTKCLVEGRPADAARVLHVIRKELRDTLTDFEGRKIRYHGDCLQGVLATGTGTTVAKDDSAEKAALCAGALMDAFSVIRQELPVAASLGLAIGLEAGPTTLTRLGVKGSMDRCAAGRSVLESEAQQRKCTAGDVRVGAPFLSWASGAVRGIFDAGGLARGLSYNRVAAELEVAGRATQPKAPTILIGRSHTRAR